MAIAIAGAFVIGILFTNPVVYGAGTGDNLIVEALNQITSAIQGIEPTVTVDQPITINAPQGEQGPQGETGSQGEQGEQGETGPSGTELYTKTQSFVVVGEGRQLVTQNCDTGDTVINGYLEDSSVIIDTNQFASQALDSNSWVVEFFPTLNPGDPFDFVIVCAEGSLPEN